MVLVGPGVPPAPAEQSASSSSMMVAHEAPGGRERDVELVGLAAAWSHRRAGARGDGPARRFRWPGASSSGYERHVLAASEGDQGADVVLAERGARDDLGVGAALDAKALVVGEVQVQHVELEVGDARRMRAASQPGVKYLRPVVDHQPALGIARPVSAARLVRAGCRRAARGELQDGTPAVEQARGGGRRDPQRSAPMCRRVALVAELPVAGRQAQAHVAVCGMRAPGRAGMVATRRPSPRTEVGGQRARLAAQRLARDDDPHVAPRS